MSQVDSVANNNQDDEMDYLNIRNATPKDFAGIREVATLSRQASLGHYMGQEEIEDEVAHYYNDNVLNGILSNPANAIYVAERGSKILGYCSVLPKDRRGRPRILQFYVRPDEQRHGVGELLFERSYSHLREAGVNQLFVSIITENTGGRAFFDKKGLALVQMYDSTWDGKTHTIAVYHTSIK